MSRPPPRARFIGRRSFVIAAVFGALSGCASTTTFTPRAIAQPQVPIKRVRVALVQNELRPAGLAVTEVRNPKLVDYGYYDLGRLLVDRAPRILTANGFEGDVRLLAAPKAGETTVVDASSIDDAMLLLEVTRFNEERPNLVLHRAYIGLRATLLQRTGASEASPKRLWEALISMRLGADEAMGVALIHRVDAELVDNLVKGLLNNMARDGMVKLPTELAVVPKA